MYYEIEITVRLMNSENEEEISQNSTSFTEEANDIDSASAHAERSTESLCSRLIENTKG